MDKYEYRIVKDRFLVGIAWECYSDKLPKHGDEVEYCACVFDVKRMYNNGKKIKFITAKVWEITSIIEEIQSIEKETKKEIYNEIPF